MKKMVSFVLAFGTIASLLAGCGNAVQDAAQQAGQVQADVSAAAEAATADAGTDPGAVQAAAGAETADDQYIVQVCDAENGEPVRDVTVQFCNDQECRMGQTDENGRAVFEGEPGGYTAHVLRVPEGYEKNDEEIGLTADEHTAAFKLRRIKSS